MDNPMALTHVFPWLTIGRRHIHSTDCWCNPKRDREQPLVVIHFRKPRKVEPPPGFNTTKAKQ